MITGQEVIINLKQWNEKQSWEEEDWQGRGGVVNGVRAKR